MLRRSLVDRSSIARRAGSAVMTRMRAHALAPRSTLDAPRSTLDDRRARLHRSPRVARRRAPGSTASPPHPRRAGEGASRRVRARSAIRPRDPPADLRMPRRHGHAAPAIVVRHGRGTRAAAARGPATRTSICGVRGGFDARLCVVDPRARRPRSRAASPPPRGPCMSIRASAAGSRASAATRAIRDRVAPLNLRQRRGPVRAFWRGPFAPTCWLIEPPEPVSDSSSLRVVRRTRRGSYE